jgi:hypothetical protein
MESENASQEYIQKIELQMVTLLNQSYVKILFMENYIHHLAPNIEGLL